MACPKIDKYSVAVNSNRDQIGWPKSKLSYLAAILHGPGSTHWQQFHLVKV